MSQHSMRNKKVEDLSICLLFRSTTRTPLPSKNLFTTIVGVHA